MSTVAASTEKTAATSEHRDSHHASHHDSPHERLHHALHHVAHLLPMQGPIGVFVHHNTLHAFEDQDFEDAVVSAGRIFGTEPFLAETDYIAALGRGRIRPADIEAVVAAEPDADVAGRWRRRRLRADLLLAGVADVASGTARFLVNERGRAEHIRTTLSPEHRLAVLDGAEEADAASALYAAALAATPRAAADLAQAPARPRDGVLAHTGTDIDLEVHPTLVRLLSSFVDQGIAAWSMPLRADGFFVAARTVIDGPLFVAPPLLASLKRTLRTLQQGAQGNVAEHVVLQALAALGVGPNDIESVLSAEALALSGWFGMMARLEAVPGLLPHDDVPARLIDALAIRLAMTLAATEAALSEQGLPRTAWKERLRGAAARRATEAAHEQQTANAVHLFDCLQVLGISARAFAQFDSTTRRALLTELETFNALTRRRLYHLAFERRHALGVLAPLAKHRQTVTPRPMTTRPSVQGLFCMDEREESMRRAMEELDPAAETYGVAGFFGMAMSFRGLDDGSAAPLCPIVVTPAHAVREQPVGEQGEVERRAKVRTRLAQMRRDIQFGSRSVVRGFVATAVLGAFSVVPAGSRILFPRAVGKLRRSFVDAMLQKPPTKLTHTHDPVTDAEINAGMRVGYTLEEQVERVANVLLPMGITTRFARLFFVVGHGASSLNNPHDSAYQCGACGGARGGPNARLFAAIANRPEVREALKGRGIVIPDDTWFVGAMHDTTSDAVTPFDVDDIPASHAADYERAIALFRATSAANARERTRRFELVSDDVSPEQALAAVEARSEHLAEPRAEYGHSSNAVAVVGRRELTRGLYLDRRSFLISYDAGVDSDDQLLTRLVAAAGPVGAGINLEYYFSTVDNERYGCGTKLPHNLAGLIGVMNGTAGDLRTGLTRQMVEIHEPVRLLFVFETSPERLGNAVGRIPAVLSLVQHRWVRVACCDPATGLVYLREPDGRFVLVDADDTPLPTVATSHEWYVGRQGHLPVARVSAAMRSPEG